MTERISGRRAARAGAGWRVPVRWRAAALFMAALLPLARLAWIAPSGGLGANPVEFVIRSLGTWSLVLLLVTLAVTPMRSVPGLRWLPGSRRMLGLFAFFYVVMHLMSYVGLDLFFDFPLLLQEIVKRRYITVGMIAVLILLPLALTSTDKSIKRLGGAKWRRLHRLVYLAAILGVFHYYMMIKAGFLEPLIYACILAGLFAVRLLKKVR